MNTSQNRLIINIVGGIIVAAITVFILNPISNTTLSEQRREFETEKKQLTEQRREFETEKNQLTQQRSEFEAEKKEFEVKKKRLTPNQTSNTINMSKTQAAKSPSTKIKNAWIEKDVIQNNQAGIRIWVRFSVSGMLNKQGHCIALFFSPGKTEIQDSWSRTWSNYTPSHDDHTYQGHSIFVPYNNLRMVQGINNIKFRIVITDEKNVQIAISGFYSFVYVK